MMPQPLDFPAQFPLADDMDPSLNHTLDTGMLYDSIHAVISSLTECGMLAVFSYKSSAPGIACEALYLRGEKMEPLSEAMSIPWGDNPQSGVIRGGEMMCIQERDELPRLWQDWSACPGLSAALRAVQAAACCAVLVPIGLFGQVTGLLQVVSETAPACSPEHFVVFQTIASQLAVVRSNQQLLQLAEKKLKEYQQLQSVLETERALLEARVAERTASLERALKVRGEFLTNITHELRTPLAMILGFTELLQSEQQGALNMKQRRYVERIGEKGHELMDTINDILDFSRIQSGRMEVNQEWVPVEMLCQSALNQIRKLAAAKRIEVCYENQSGAVFVFIDPERGRQILGNLLHNAFKFTPEGSRIGLTVSENETARTIEFLVWDEGIGIPDGALSEVFEPFMQVDAILTREHEGAGLGLVLARHLVEMQRGSLRIESEAGRGTRVTVSLPVLSREG
ncbi:MAG: HAMP domain-containing histidine kinase [Anaerolineaceae bacterium]|nr:HAMP domain-containing histidine kinase [Anaerolineaceae bacterium]